jgi:D-3-phosphoglycerate dehydrogenase
MITADFDDKQTKRLGEIAEVRLGGWGQSGSVPSETEVIELLQGVDILVEAWEHITEEVLDRTKLRYIASVRGGPGGNVDLAAAARRGIPVTGTAGREAVPVAEFAIGLMIASQRYIPITYHLLADRKLTSPDPPPPGDLGWGMDPGDPWLFYRGEDLAGKTLGLVGLGTVGREVARRAAAFDMDVLAYDPYVDSHSIARLVALDELLSSSDIVSIHAKYTPQTNGLIGRAEIARMKKDALLVNTARANIVDREALLDAVRSGSIRGAALDVHYKEPLDPDDPFLELTNVICTPHIAGSTYGATAVQSVQCADNICRFLAGESLECLATPPVANGA